MKTVRALLTACLAAGPAMGGVQFDTTTYTAPDTSSDASSLVSVPSGPAAGLYYMVREGMAKGGEELWVSTDDGVSWYYPDLGWGTDFPNGPSLFFFGTATWGSNMLVYHPGLGTAGGLVLRMRDPDPDAYGNTLDRLVWFDPVAPAWYWLGGMPGTATVMGHGCTVVGNHMYGIWHAGGGNFGGPVARVDLLNPGAIDERTELTGLSGQDPHWLSRAAQFASLGGLIYGIKNDWATPQPAAGAGDRLFRFDPGAFQASVFDGGNPWQDTNWHARQTPATDLGRLPFEPGSGSCLVALPPNWSREIGAAGGLFIIAGESPSDQEGWAAASALYALYDVASGTFTVRSLPGVTGTGTSACLHDGKVYIKRGRTPDENNELWVASGTQADPCATRRLLSVESSPVSGVSIQVIPGDCDGAAGGATPLTRSFGDGDFVSLIAPAVPGYRFVQWDLDGFFATDQATLVLRMDAAHAATAIYELRCNQPLSFAVQSTPPTDIEIAYTPADCGGGSSGRTPFTREFGQGETVTFTAPCVAGYTFSRWMVDGSEAGTNPNLTLTLEWQVVAEAVYEPAAPPYEDGCLKCISATAPVDSSWASSLVSDGDHLYLMRRDSHQLFRTADACTWTELRRITEDLGGYHGDWYSGILAYAPTIGAKGSLILRHRDAADGLNKIARYDIAQDRWSWTSTFTAATHGGVVVGNHWYGVWHAGGGNFGGPLVRADLTQPSRIIDERTVIGGSLGGRDAHWLSRAAVLAVLDGFIYGTKNDWQTNPAGDGDRLFMFDPNDWTASVWDGTGPADYWVDTKWHARATFATDLGRLPFEPGYGAAIVALPAHWACGVGNKGGLFILAGRSPSNHEGWGDASRLYAVYDIAAGTFTTGLLPAATGSGTSATFHKGKVYIKRGGQPDAPYNSELWIVQPATVGPDLDQDGDVDLNDFATFQLCFNGASRPPAAPGCARADFEPDGDVDLNDFATFQLCFNGASRPPACP